VVSCVVYLDHAATTPWAPRVADAMAEILGEPLAKPLGTPHGVGAQDTDAKGNDHG
jgi:cysteine sulfinate desulfinase/cysteine desulfurase-like protein